VIPTGRRKCRLPMAAVASSMGRRGKGGPDASNALSLKPCTLAGPMLAPPRPLESTSGREWGAGLPESLSLPASLCAGLRFSPEQFAELCQAGSAPSSGVTQEVL
jgi:hypothetical protein